MAASYIVHDYLATPLMGDAVVLPNGQTGRQRIGTIQKREVIVQHATPTEFATIVSTYFPGGAGDFQMDEDYPSVNPWVDQITGTYQGRVTGTKRT